MNGQDVVIREDPMVAILEAAISLAADREEFFVASCLSFVGSIRASGDIGLLKAASANLSELAATAIEEVKDVE